MNLRLSGTLQGEVRTWTIERSPARLGRSSSNAVHLPDASVSREHAELVRDGERWLLRDLGSRNGSRVNAEDAADPREVRPGDWIEIGHLTLRVGAADALGPERPPPESSSSARLRVSDVLERPAIAHRDPARLVRLLGEAGRLLVMPRPMEETCDQILGFIERALPTSRLVILLRDADGGIQPVAGRYRGASGKEPLALPQSIMRAVLDENTAVLTDNAMQDPRFAGAQSIVGQHIHSAMAVPLFDNERVLGILYADSTRAGVVFDEPDLELLTLLANMAAVKISNARLLEAEEARQRLAHELAAATDIQANLLPEPPAGITDWRCHARIETCHAVGGDLFDFHRRPDGTLVFAIGDVAGRGMGAALLMSSALASARVLYDVCGDPLTLIRRLNEVMSFRADERCFLTLFVGYLDPARGTLRYVNAGHPEPLVVRGERWQGLPATGIPVGVLEDFEWTMGELAIGPGETLAAYSDGIPESRQGEAFFDSARIAAALAELEQEPDLRCVADGLLARVRAFAGDAPQADDITLLLLRRDPAA